MFEVTETSNRILIPNITRFQVVRANGKVEKPQFSHNSRVDAGANAIAQLIGSAAGLPFIYVALTSNSSAVVKTDTTLSGEYTTAGLGRVAASYGSYTAPATLNGAASYVLTATWSCTSNGQAVNKIAAFTAISVGTMGFETLLGSTETLNNGDTGLLTWTFQV
jgi:hypothetical protein